jgi:hypothetical protein
MDLGDFKLKDEVKDYLKTPGGMARFHFECGDQFIKEGGKIEARLTVSNYSEGSKATSKTDFSIATSHGGLSSSDMKLLERYQNESRLEIIVDRSNTGRELKSYTVQEMDIALRSFANDIRNSPSPDVTSFKTYSFDSLLAEFFDQSEIFNPYPEWAQKLASNFRHVRQLIELKSNLKYIEMHPTQFIYQDPQELKDAITKLDDILENNKIWWNRIEWALSGEE